MNLAYRWFWHLSLEDKVPDHSTFSKNRHGWFRDSDVFRFVFEHVLQRCMSEGLVGGEGCAPFMLMPAANGIMRWGRGSGTRAVREYLQALDETDNPPKRVPSTDPSACYKAVRGGLAFYAYSTNYLIDVDVGVIMDVEPTPAYRSAKVEPIKNCKGQRTS